MFRPGSTRDICWDDSYVSEIIPAILAENASGYPIPPTDFQFNDANTMMSCLTSARKLKRKSPSKEELWLRKVWAPSLERIADLPDDDVSEWAV
jgi:hypothetical protein